MAHPTRLALVGLLRREGPLTATQAGELLGQSPASCSFHLRQLAKHGLVEEAGGGTGRERPWKANARPEWQEAAQFGDTILYVTPDELVELGRQIEALVEGYVERTADRGLRPEAARPVTFLHLAFPAPLDGSVPGR